ncbi:MAG: cytochrome c-type biogenesis protein [Endozoicomonas sp.]
MMNVSKLVRLVPALFFSLLMTNALAAIDSYEFDSPEQERRFYELTNELRCPKCQNQSIADSNAPIAHDLRREVHRLLVEEVEDEGVIDFMLSRYGEFVLYTPRFEAKTLVLWLGPLFLLLIGLVVLVVVVRNHKMASGVEHDNVTEEQRQALEQALVGKAADDGSPGVESLGKTQ